MFSPRLAQSTSSTRHIHRRFVFDNYTWARDGPEYAEWNGKVIPARIPLTALISGELNTSTLVVYAHSMVIKRQVPSREAPLPMVI